MNQLEKIKSMTPNEKAWEIINGFTADLFEKGHRISKPMMKDCALKAVEFIMPIAKATDSYMPAWVRHESPDQLGWEDYWKQVRLEIQNA